MQNQPQPPRRKAWIPPQVKRMVSGSAENTAMMGADGCGLS
jgi:hypothetical protein